MENKQGKQSISRKRFLKSSIGLVGVTSIGSDFIKDRNFISNSNANPATVIQIENDDLVLEVKETGAFSVTIKSTNSKWEADAWEGIACRVICSHKSGKRQQIDFGSNKTVKITQNDNAVNMVFKEPDSRLIVKTSLVLKEQVLDVSIDEVTIPSTLLLESIEYPFRSFYLKTEEDDGYFVLSEGEGCLVPTYKSPYAKKLGTTQFWYFHDASHSPMAEINRIPPMPFYGAQKQGSGYTAIIETTDDFSFRYLINYDFHHAFVSKGKQSPYTRILDTWPVWLSQKGELGYQRKMRYEFSDNLSYVKMAKIYRKEAITKGDHVSLRVKAEKRPQINNLRGAPYLAYYAGYPHTSSGYFEYTYQQLNDVIDDLSGSMGLRRAFIHFWGAYSVQPPGRLPFDETPGSVDELKLAVDKSKERGFLFTFYNNTSAQLEETDLWLPTLIRKDRNLNIPLGRRWSRLCSTQYVDLFSKDMAQISGLLGLEACYADAMNSGRLDECYDPKHPTTRSEDRAARLRFYQYVHSLGLIFGGEHCGWWNASELEYTNGVGGMGRRGDFFNLFPVPLYQLVFHDALIPFCHAGDDYSMTEGTSFEDKILRDLLRGIPPMFFINLWDHKKWRNKIKNCYDIISDVAAAVMYDEMLTHRWVTSDQMVQESEFESGIKITVNFDEIEREGIPAKGYQVYGMKTGARRGSLTTRWKISY